MDTIVHVSPKERRAKRYRHCATVALLVASFTLVFVIWGKRTDGYSRRLAWARYMTDVCDALHLTGKLPPDANVEFLPMCPDRLNPEGVTIAVLGDTVTFTYHDATVMRECNGRFTCAFDAANGYYIVDPNGWTENRSWLRSAAGVLVAVCMVHAFILAAFAYSISPRKPRTTSGQLAKPIGDDFPDGIPAAKGPVSKIERPRDA